MTGLPREITCCLFDLDGVLTSTAALHQTAWKRTFDAFLAHREGGTEPTREFTESDYLRYVDGRPRYDGVRTFLASRDITLPDGDNGDAPSFDTVSGLGNRKNELLNKTISTDGVQPYPGSVRYLEAVRDAGLSIGVVTSSENATTVLDAADLTKFVEARIDGVIRRAQGLPGKPAPDTFLAGARALDVDPEHAAVFEDALAGVEAGRAGKFGYVIGVDRTNQSAELRDHGADIVVKDLADLL